MDSPPSSSQEQFSESSTPEKEEVDNTSGNANASGSNTTDNTIPAIQFGQHFFSDWNSSYDEQREGDHLVTCPDGTQILCDSPDPSTDLRPPSYAEKDEASRSTSDQQVVLSTQPSKQKDDEGNNGSDSTDMKKAVKRDKSSTVASTSRTKHKKSVTTKPRRIIGNYTLVSTIGSGSMGKVRLAIHNHNGNKLAVKIVPTNLMDSKQKEQQSHEDHHRQIRTVREANIMMLLHHPFIVSLKEMILLEPYYYLFMEYVNGGQLLDYIIAHGKLKEKQARRFARQILSALDYCHRNSIVHRDLKIENILISQSGNIKIIDFGLSNLFSPRSSLNTFCGSLYFAAPELLNAKAYTGPEVDVWSFGVVVYVLVCGKVPFDDQNMPALHEKIKRGVVDYPSHLSTDCKSILSRMLVTNSTHRATVSELMIHPWMNKGYDGPVNNYVPERLPLTLPIDMNVVRGMTEGFGFGTEEEIKQQLEDIITSDEYQKAAQTLMERTAEVQRLHRHNSHHMDSSSHANGNGHHHRPRFFSSTSSFLNGSSSANSTNHNSKAPMTLPNDDPQSIPAAYHPLVSIYYLVKERMEREHRIAESNNPDTDLTCYFDVNKDSMNGKQTTKDSSVDSKPSFLRIPNITLPESIHPTIKATNFDTEAIYHGNNGKTPQYLPVEDNNEEHSIHEKLHMLENGLSRLFSRSSGKSSHRRPSATTNGESSVNDAHTNVDDDMLNAHTMFERRSSSKDAGSTNNNHTTMFRRISQALSRTSTNDSAKSRRRKSAASTHYYSDKQNPSAAVAAAADDDFDNHYPEPPLSPPAPVTTSTSTPIPIPSTSHYRYYNEDNNSIIDKSSIGEKSPQISTSYALSPPLSGSSRFPNSLISPPISSVHKSVNLKDEEEDDDVAIATAAAAAAAAAAAFSLQSNNKKGKFSRMFPRRMTVGGNTSVNAQNHANFIKAQQEQQHIPKNHHHQHLNSTNRTHDRKHTDKDDNSDLGVSSQQCHLRQQPSPTTSSSSSSSSSSPPPTRQTTTATTTKNGMADESIKPVFLKGLFSVTTTSTKHPSVIRADLIRVLERLGVKWRETKGKFECVHMPSIDMNHVAFSQQQQQQQGQYMPMTSMANEEAPSYQQAEEDMTYGKTNNGIAPLPDLVMRFEIYIVKVPWLLGMHGLQFRRVGGDSWQYKNMCSKILAELKL
ncbi:hypothetical protein BDF20DRAFT_839190 [Mycotypha africana]|uniref:uncharacterized protein n=1 Tax=Mycotypha africana TaxID=64632 RepID=UPI002301557F|nr:uncharacterized protein BDF20DRAFT_839190 [Mycotypha africana]KAI8969253.1 hypothetical protein BDF20DRAFT_839190 [Mycotypha africana]